MVLVSADVVIFLLGVENDCYILPLINQLTQLLHDLNLKAPTFQGLVLVFPHQPRWCFQDETSPHA